MASIHPTAVIHPEAELAEDVRVGPYSVIGPGVRIDGGTEIASHVVIDGPTKIGKNCRFSPSPPLVKFLKI